MDENTKTETFTPRDVYEFIVISAMQNGCRRRESNILAVELTWRMYNQIKENKPTTIQEHQEFIDSFYKYLDYKRRG